MLLAQRLLMSARQLSGILINYWNSSNEFEYLIDGSGNNYVKNQGSSGSTNNLMLYTGEALEVGATQVFTIGDLGQTVAVYRVSSTAWTYHTAPYIGSIRHLRRMRIETENH